MMNSFQINLDLNNDKGEGDTSTYIENGEWHLLGNFRTHQSHCSTVMVTVINLDVVFFKKQDIKPR